MAEHEKPDWLGGGDPPPAVDAPIAAPDPKGRRGERQDGAGVSASPGDRSDARPAGQTGADRSGPRQGTGPSEDPFKAHRGDPARLRGGAAQGSGAGAGGGGAGESEEPDPDSTGGGGREEAGGRG